MPALFHFKKRGFPTQSLILTLGLFCLVSSAAPAWAQVQGPDPVPADDSIAKDSKKKILTIFGGADTDPKAELERRIEELRKDFWQSGISLSATIIDQPVHISIGVRTSGARLKPYEILLDEEKQLTDAKLGDPAVWVRHRMDLRPQFSWDLHLANAESAINSLAVIQTEMSTSQIVYLVKRHPMGQVYDQHFWGYTKQDAKIVAQTLPVIFESADDVHDTKRFLPGEEMSVEQFGSLTLFIGPNSNLTGPVVGALLGEVRAFVGYRKTLIGKHFRSNYSFMRGNQVHVVLEKMHEDSNGFFAALTGKLNLLFLGFKQNIASYSHERAVYSDRIIDLVVDLNGDRPQTYNALAKSVNGDYGDLLELTEQNLPEKTGITDLSRSFVQKITNDTTKTLMFRESSDAMSEIKETTDFTKPVGGVSRLSEVVHELKIVRKGMWYEHDMKFSLATRNDTTDSDLNRAFMVEYSTHNRFTKHDEIEELLRASRAMATGDTAKKLDEWLGKLTNYDGRTHADLLVHFDPVAVGNLMQNSPEMVGEFYLHWARAAGLRDAELWKQMTDEERESSAWVSEEMHTHFENARTFIRALKEELDRSKGTTDRTAFIRAIRHVEQDLYPIAALYLMSDPGRMIWSLRLTVRNDHIDDTIEVFGKGHDYTPLKLQHELGSF